MNSVVQKIADWAATLTFERIPETARDVAVRCIIDTVAVSLPGAVTPVGQRAREAALEGFAAGEAVVLGETRRLAPAGAALANATAAHALDFDDNCYAGVVHGSAVVAPAALAVTQMMNGTGRDLLTAFIVGVEAQYAIGEALTLAIYERGIFTSALLGVAGSAVSTAKALGLDANATANALGLALCGAGGVKACLGTDAKPLLLGQAAHNGIVSALLARAGATGPQDVIEHHRGFVHLLAQGIFEASAIETLGERWRLLEPGIDFKRAPVCLSAAAALDGILDTMSEQGLKEADIERIVCELAPIARANLVYDEPSSIQEAQFSSPFVIACAMRFGEVRLQHLDQALIDDLDFRNAMSRVETKVSERLKEDRNLVAKYPEGAFLTVYCRDGRKFERFSGAGRGTASMPLSDDEIDRKFLDCAASVQSEESSRSMLDRLRHVSGARSVRDLIS